MLRILRYAQDDKGRLNDKAGALQLASKAMDPDQEACSPQRAFFLGLCSFPLHSGRYHASAMPVFVEHSFAL